MDLSSKALEMAQARLGERAAHIDWINGDITGVPLSASHFDLWHDRAVFHFLTDPDARRRYLENLLHVLKPGGHLVMAAFTPEAPPKCSGLLVEHYTLEKMQEVLGPEFELRRHCKELHVTPGGVEQMYLYCLLQRRA